VRAPNEGEVLVKIAYLSLDPAMRGWMNDVKSYIPPVQIGEVMRAGGVGEVLESRHPGFKEAITFTAPSASRNTRRSTARADESRSAARASAGVSRHARHAGDDGLLRSARGR
jgi:NADPH-dependent curcumin reductase CurA